MRPSFALAYRNRGCSYHFLGDKANARANFATALELEPNAVDRIPDEYRKQ